MVKKILKKFCKYNPFHLHTPHLDAFINNIENIRDDVKSVREDLVYEKELLERQLVEHKDAIHKNESIISTLLESIPDMAWYKDLQGRYVYANQSIKDNLLCTDDPIGKTDVELAMNAKMKYGEDKHTFGEKCSNSDAIVIESGKPQRFVENGKVRGKHLELEVYKNVVRDRVTGIVLGTVGTGRDITEYVEFVKNNDCNECPMVDVFKKNRFGD